MQCRLQALVAVKKDRPGDIASIFFTDFLLSFPANKVGVDYEVCEGFFDDAGIHIFKNIAQQFVQIVVGIVDNFCDRCTGGPEMKYRFSLPC